MKKTTVVIALVVLFTLVPTQAAKFQPFLGEDFPVVSGTDLVSQKEINSATMLASEDVKGLVVFFTSYTCPVAIAYEERVNALAAEYGEKVPFVALNANAARENDQDQAKYASEKGYKYPVVMDKYSKLAQKVGASVTPEFYLLDKSGKVVYHGPLDDSQDKAYVETHLLKGALDAFLAGETIAEGQDEVQAFGCSIKFGEKPEKSSHEDKGHDHSECGHDH